MSAVCPNMTSTTGQGGIKRHAWPVWGGVSDCSASDLTERNGGMLYIKAVGGHIDWIVLGRKEKVTAHHADHYLSIRSPILRDLGYYPGPAVYHAAPELVSDNLRDNAGNDRAILCGRPGLGKPGSERHKETGLASLNGPKIHTQATSQDIDHESFWTTFPAYVYHKGEGAACSMKVWQLWSDALGRCIRLVLTRDACRVFQGCSVESNLGIHAPYRSGTPVGESRCTMGQAR